MSDFIEEFEEEVPMERPDSLWEEMRGIIYGIANSELPEGMDVRRIRFRGEGERARFWSEEQSEQIKHKGRVLHLLVDLGKYKNVEFEMLEHEHLGMFFPLSPLNTKLLSRYDHKFKEQLDCLLPYGAIFQTTARQLEILRALEHGRELEVKPLPTLPRKPVFRDFEEPESKIEDRLKEWQRQHETIMSDLEQSFEKIRKIADLRALYKKETPEEFQSLFINSLATIRTGMEYHVQMIADKQFGAALEKSQEHRDKLLGCVGKYSTSLKGIVDKLAPWEPLFRASKITSEHLQRDAKRFKEIVTDLLAKESKS